MKLFIKNQIGPRCIIKEDGQKIYDAIHEALQNDETATLDSPTATAALNRLQTEKIDGYDLFILESMDNHGVLQVITDDGDFATVPAIQVFTANRNVIQAARAQGRVIAR